MGDGTVTRMLDLYRLKDGAIEPTNIMKRLLDLYRLPAGIFTPVGGGVPAVAPSTVTKVGATVNTAAVNAQTNTQSFTVSSGTNLALVVAVGWYQGASEGITSVTFNGDAMTQIGVSTAAALYILPNPDVATGDVVATFVNANTYSVMSITLWSGVDQATGYHDAATANDTTATSTVNVANVASGEVTIDCHFMNYGDEDAPGADQVSQCDVPTLGTPDRYVMASSIDTTSTGTVTMSWAQTESSYWFAVAAAIKKAS